ncbi:MAG: hypothetical protein ACXVFD_09390 [Gaiellaceae bacterium]
MTGRTPTLVGVLVLMMAAGAQSDAAEVASLQLGFVRAGSIGLASANGTAAHIVLRRHGRFSYLEPAWSRDGRLAATRYEETDSHGYSAVVVTRPHQPRLILDLATFTGSSAWAPDGKRLVLVLYNYGTPPGGTLTVVSIATPRRTSPVAESGGSVDDIDDEPAWAPDGKTIAFSRPAFSGADGDYVTRHVFLIGADGKHVRQLTQTPGFNPSWSPDSQRLAFDDDHNIHVIEADGNGERRLTSSGRDTHPAWSPNGRQIAFQRGPSVWLMNADGSHAHKAIANASEPAWKPR